MKSALHRQTGLLGSLLLLLFASGCGVEDGEVVSEGEYLVFEAIGMGQQGLTADTTEAVYRDEAEWQAGASQFSALAPFLPVDFSQSMVLAIALPTESGGYAIEVESVERQAEELLVEYVVSVPSDDCIPVVGEALPFQVVRVARDDRPVRFLRRNESYRCTWKQ